MTACVARRLLKQQSDQRARSRP